MWGWFNCEAVRASRRSLALAAGGVQVRNFMDKSVVNAAKPVGGDTGLKDIKHIAMALLHTKARVTGSVEKRDLTAEYRNHVLKF